MLPFPVSMFMQIVHITGHFYPDFSVAVGDGSAKWAATKIIDSDDRQKFSVIYKSNESLCELYGLDASLATVRKMLGCLSDEGSTYGRFFGYGEELHERLKDETATKMYLSLTSAEATAYRAEKPFGADVYSKFPAAMYDIEEASKCIALGRATAATFHSVRCLEAAIRALARCLGIPDPTKAADRNWGKMLGSVKSEIDRRWPTSSDRLVGDGQIFDELHAALAAMQNPWRNAIMHLDQKYTEEEARHIFDIVAGLMRRVASRCDEMGEPKV